MVDGILGQAMALVPLTRSAMQYRQRCRLVFGGAHPEHVSKEVVIAIPLSPVIQRHNKEVAPLQRLQHFPALILIGDGVAQRPVQPGQYGGLQQEVAHILWLALQDLFDQKIEHKAMASGEGPDEIGRL